MNDDIKSIIEQMLESGMSKEEINSFFLETFDIDLSEESTTMCSECKFYKNIFGTGTCGKHNNFLSDNTTGCYFGVRR